jgi:hypothetical protein
MFSLLFSLVFCKLGFITLVFLLAFALVGVLQIQSYHAYFCCFCFCHCFTSIISSLSFSLFLFSLVFYKLVIIKFTFFALASIVVL